MSSIKTIDGGVTAPMGFSASGVHAGIKGKGTKPDIALIVSAKPAAIAATFTTNKVQGAHVKLCKQHLAGRKARAIVVNSGCANACTGPRGLADAEQMARIVAEEIGADDQHIFVCSTGTIGISLPMDKIETGIIMAVKALSGTGGAIAAKAIMTTDTVDKQAAVEFTVDSRTVRVGGMAKGAGMIEPNMATMLAFLTTDAAVEPTALQKCLSTAVAQSFNRVTVDGDQSCNDTVLLMANGAAGNRPLNEKHPDWESFAKAVNDVTRELAIKIARDGEGATKFVTVVVAGAATDVDAKKAIRAVANSLLVKTSWFGGDPNWGRVIDAVGYSGAEMKEELVDISYDDLFAVKGGMANPETSIKDLEKVLAKKSFTLNIDLHLGKGSDTVYTCDCSEEYVRINSEYMT
jgi:glutamate N-acetyltransferase / amino-acid N-acetyltransferase